MSEPEQNENLSLAVDTADDIAAVKKAHAEAAVLTACGYSVVWTPLLLIAVKFAAAVMNIPFEIDHRILDVALAANATIIAYGFGRGFIQRFLP